MHPSAVLLLHNYIARVSYRIFLLGVGGGNISLIAYSGLIQEFLEFLLGEGKNISSIAYSGLIQEFLEFLLGEGENISSIAYSG